jgi:hypothetical protein
MSLGFTPSIKCELLILTFIGLNLCPARCEQPVPTDLRTWTSSDGKTIQAKLLNIEVDQAVLQLANGTTAKVPLTRLSSGDKDFIKQKTLPQTAKAEATSNTRVPIDKRSWPVNVEVAPRSVEIKAVEEKPNERRCVYRSESFEFVSQDKLAVSIMKELATTFEATRSLVNALPWGIEPKPPADLGYYEAKFYVTRDDYIKDGGPANSGGVYFSRDRIFRIPFQGLGLELRGKTYFKKPGFKEETLVHEVTHQMMHDFLPFLPTWVIEGTAEYTESLPYNAGKFRANAHESAVKSYIKLRQEHSDISPTDFRPFSDHMAMKHETWGSLSENSRTQHLLYFQSYLLVYYFCHVDGDGKGTRFLKYLDAMAKARDDWELFFKNPAVKKGLNGSFTYPTSLKLPEQKRDESFGIEQLSILLDGRAPEELEKDIKAGFKKMGLKM